MSLQHKTNDNQQEKRQWERDLFSTTNGESKF